MSTVQHPIVIWFNPEADIYQAGPMTDFDLIRCGSHLCDRFELIYEFTDVPHRIIKKTIDSLNKARQSQNALV